MNSDKVTQDIELLLYGLDVDVVLGGADAWSDTGLRRLAALLSAERSTKK